MVVLWLNADYKTQLQIIGVSAREQAFQRLWASTIMADLTKTVLRRGVLEEVTTALAFQTIDSLFIGRFYSDYDHLKSLIRRPDFDSMVSAWAQELVSVAEIVEETSA